MPFLYNNLIFTVNFNRLTILLTPPLLRQPSQMAWVNSLAAPMQNDNNLFNQYVTGTEIYPAYSNSVIYLPGDRVVGSNNIIYEQIWTTTTLALAPPDPNYWLQINPTFIGAEERSVYNSQKITLEYALNRQYQILPFASNPYAWSGANHTNQIYINNNDTIGNRFIISTTNIYSSTMSKTGQIERINGGDWMGRGFSGFNQNDFTVWVPNLTLYPEISNSSVYQYTSDFILAGIVFDVESY